MTTSEEPGATATRRTPLAMRFAISFLLGVALILGVGAGALYAWGQQYAGRILPGVHAGATDLSGLTRDAARAAIGGAYASLGSGRIVLSGPGGDMVIDEASIGRGPDVGAMLDAALAAGRQGAPLADLIGAPQAALRGVDLAAAVAYDPAKLAASIDAVAQANDQAAVDATVTVAPDGSFAVTPSRVGRGVDRAALTAALAAQLVRLDAPSEIRVQVPMVAANPSVDTTAATAARNTADRMAADLVLHRGTELWTIPGSAIRALMSFAPSTDGSVVPVVDQGGLTLLLANVAKSVDQAARSAEFKVSGAHVIVSAASREGRTMDVAATQAAVLDVLMARQAGTAEPALAPVVAATQPAISSDLPAGSVTTMQVVGKWTTWFSIWLGNGFGANIWVPAALVNGYVIAPGATFDFWKVVGTPTAAQGYKQGNAIIDGHSETLGAFAGGICSTSTTLFNAALQAGMKMGARLNHYYYISRYPLGLDATVFISSGGSSQTMSFTNDTPYPVLIQSLNTRSGGTGYVTFKLWSLPNGRSIKIGTPTVKNYTKASDSVVYTSSLPKGATNRLEVPEDGQDVWRTVTTYQDGKVIRNITYYSHYSVVTGVLQVGTGDSSTPAPSPGP